MWCYGRPHRKEGSGHFFVGGRFSLHIYTSKSGTQLPAICITYLIKSFLQCNMQLVSWLYVRPYTQKLLLPPTSSQLGLYSRFLLLLLHRRRRYTQLLPPQIFLFCVLLLLLLRSINLRVKKWKRPPASAHLPLHRNSSQWSNCWIPSCAFLIDSERSSPFET